MLNTQPGEFLARHVFVETGAATNSLAKGQLRSMLVELEQLVVPEMLKDTSALGETVNDFAVQISLIGQVKAGKTALSNALLGVRELLPSDINPWTSVVTSVHLNQVAPSFKRAIFKFFTRDEWDNMVSTGGRVAAMAQRADFEMEVDDVRKQIADMQEKTRKRLGKNFELLLNSQHAFSEFNHDLVKRYVCLGEEGAEGEAEGRFADMTRSANLYMDSEHFNYPLTLVDTPGVNDPFLVREAVTLDSLGTADICIIVLSAHQALSTSDLALMRILLGLKQEQIVLFINRVDELAEPAAQMVEIHDRIKETLSDQQLPEDVPIVFGSAAWADASIKGDLSDLSESSVTALESLMSRLAVSGEPAPDLSGISELQEVLDRKATRDVCGPFVAGVASRAADIARRSRALLAKTTAEEEEIAEAPRVDIANISAEIATLQENLAARFEEIKQEYGENMLFEISGSFQDFIFSESRSLNRHLENRQNPEDWQPDTDKLRRSLNNIYKTKSHEMMEAIDALYNGTHNAFVELYGQFGEEDAATLGLSKPILDEPGIPVSLMRTMTIDLSTSWLTGWLVRRFRRETFMKKFKAITMEQLRSTSVEVRDRHIDDYCDEALAKLLGFIDSHLFAMQELASLQDEGGRVAFLRKIDKGDSIEARVEGLNDLIARFEQLSLAATRNAKDLKMESA